MVSEGANSTPTQPGSADYARVCRERDLLLKLVDLGEKNEIEPFLEDALFTVMAVTGARRGYLEVRDEKSKNSTCFWKARECTAQHVEEMRQSFSSGIVAEALATGEVIRSASALGDPRYSSHESVQRNRIEAVLCAPIGSDPPFGVIYMQDRQEPGEFSESAKRYVEIFARHIAKLADRLLILRRVQDDLDSTRPFRERLKVERLVGRSSALAELLRQIEVVAALDISILLTGASGTGKTEIARILHANSRRNAGPFVELNCGALPDGLVESELFGSVQGAHSTALRKSEGKVGAAEGGTLFLDEVGELSLPAQAKLLQLLQSKEYYALGASRPTKIDVRIIAATNANLQEAVSARKFREDLFYRLQVLPIRMPDLRERVEDVPELCAYFAARACETHRLPWVTLSPAAQRAAEAAEWPGNIRQLANAVEAAAIRAAGTGATQITREHLFPGDAVSPKTSEQKLTFQEATRAFQAELLSSVLMQTNWNVTETAARLDLTRSHVYNLINSFGLTRGR